MKGTMLCGIALLWTGIVLHTLKPEMSAPPQTLVPGGCELEAAAHEQEGPVHYFNCATVGLSAPPKSIQADILRSHIGDRVKITIEVLEPRQLEKVSR